MSFDLFAQLFSNGQAGRRGIGGDPRAASSARLEGMSLAPAPWLPTAIAAVMTIRTTIGRTDRRPSDDASRERYRRQMNAPGTRGIRNRSLGMPRGTPLTPPAERRYFTV